MNVRQMRECHFCHRIGYQQFFPWGAGEDGWECTNDRACMRRRRAWSARNELVCSIDAQGYLIGPDGKRGVTLPMEAPA